MMGSNINRVDDLAAVDKSPARIRASHGADRRHWSVCIFIFTTADTEEIKRFKGLDKKKKENEKSWELTRNWRTADIYPPCMKNQTTAHS